MTAGVTVTIKLTTIGWGTFLGVGFGRRSFVLCRSGGTTHTERHNEQVSYCPPLGLLLLGDRPGLGARKDSSQSRSPTSRVDLQTSPADNKQQRKTEEASDSAFHREYWEPCNSTFREYIVNGCTW